MTRTRTRKPAEVLDYVPVDDGPTCAACPGGCGMYRHRPRLPSGRSSGPERQDCLYCPCEQYRPQLDLGL